jgi:hypothetical protein
VNSKLTTNRPFKQENRKMKLAFRTLAVISISLFLSTQALATCTVNTAAEAAWETNRNVVCPGAPEFETKYWYTASQWIQFSDTGGTTLTLFSNNFYCASTLTSYNEVTSMNMIDDSSDPRIAFTRIKFAIGQKSTAAGGGKVEIESTTADGCYRSQPSPIIINLGQNSQVKMTSAEAGVDFDLAGLGLPQRLGWTPVNPDAGWLIRGTTVINGQQLFGNLNPQAPPLDPSEPDNGYRALRLFDENNDGQITSADAIWSELHIWFDRNHDAITQAGEVVSLAESGIESLSLSYKTVGKKIDMVTSFGTAEM